MQLAHTLLTEGFNFGVTDPDFNDPASPDFQPGLLPFDLTRGGPYFLFHGHADINAHGHADRHTNRYADRHRNRNGDFYPLEYFDDYADGHVCTTQVARPPSDSTVAVWPTLSPARVSVPEVLWPLRIAAAATP